MSSNGTTNGVDKGDVDEQVPLIEKPAKVELTKAATPADSAPAPPSTSPPLTSPLQSSIKKRGGLAKSSLHHRSVDTSLLESSQEQASKKQLLFRTASDQNAPSAGYVKPLSVHYSTENGLAAIGGAIPEEVKGANGGINRFKVAKVSDDEEFEEEDEDLPLSCYETKNLKSFKHYTKEALPRLDNYRNVMSVHGHLQRPTLDELHGVQTTIQFDRMKSKSPSRAEDGQDEAPDLSKVVKFGWIQGVLVRCMLNIWGVMLFLRLTWVTAQSGVFFGILVVLLATAVTILTTMSMSAICTNGEVKGGGTYYMISRSLGPEFGGSIGIIFSLANAVAIAMYAVGFAEALRDLLLSHGIKIFDAGLMDIRIISCTLTVVMLIIVFIGTEWESKTQMGLLVILLAAIGDFIIGLFLQPSPEQQSKGFVGWSKQAFVTNMVPAYRNEDFFSTFAVFFPAATGILAGANISGDLKDPSKSIPKGTFLAIFITSIVYVLFVAFAGAICVRDANGLTALVVNATSHGASRNDIINLVSNCTLAPNGKCEYGLHNYFQIIELVSYWGPIIYAGIFAATISSALASLVSAPKVFQALCNDKLFPGIEFFGKGFGVNNEPKRGYVLAFAIAIGCCLIGELNAIAPIISNFFLAAYVLINFACFHATFSKSTGFRPSYKYYSKWVSLLGAMLCLSVMFITSWATALLTFVIVLGLYYWVQQRKPDVNWGSTTQAQSFRSALQSVYKLNSFPEHVKNYRPQILLLSGNPSFRPSFVDLAFQITKQIGFTVCGQVVTSPLSFRAQTALSNECTKWLIDNNIKAFYNLIQESSFYQGVRAMTQSLGLGKLKPNIIMLGMKKNWVDCEPAELLDYYQTIHLIFDRHFSLIILSLPNGLDISESITATDVNKANGDAPQPNSSPSVDVSLFRTKQKKGFIDVWWLYDDGGLTLLIPYIISTHSQWKDCKLRIFTLTNRKSELDIEQRNMAALLSKFRIDYSDVILVTDILKPPKEDTKKVFNSVIAKYVWDEAEDKPVHPRNPINGEEAEDLNKLYIADSDLLSFQDKTYRHLRLREELLKNSKDSKMIVITLPMPRKNQTPPVLYMAWLEMLTRDLPPVMLIRGNHTDVLTFYS